MPRDLTVAFAGHAPTSKSNVTALLGDFLHLASPDAQGYYEKPERWGEILFYVLATEATLPEGVKHSLNFALSVEEAKVYLVVPNALGDALDSYGEYVDSILRFDDPLTELVDILSDQPRPHLCVSWDESDPDDEQLINLAHQYPAIRVSDLVQGLVSIVPDTEEAETEEEQAEEPQETPPATASKAQAPAELDEKPKELDEKPSAAAAEGPSTLEGEVAAAHRAVTQSALVVGQVEVSSELLREVHHALNAAYDYFSAIDLSNARKNLADGLLYSPLTVALHTQMQAVNALLSTSEPYREAPAASGAADKPKPAGKPVKVIWDETAQEWKKAGRGRPRAGVRTGLMDAAGTVVED
ncbi:hypothetical protein [Streptomyces sp. NPDC017448]|uniref:hypothetical protein n=1 Tax=Streptomyces sp. NPDC017448 TaxID=3364996 RepID=UPI0037B2DD0B